MAKFHNNNSPIRKFIARKTNTIHLVLVFILFTGCHAASHNDHSENQIITHLNDIKGKGLLFGHQDDLAYGISWKYIDGESDVKRVTGDYPALFGWELGGLERDDAVNLDNVPFDKMVQFAIWADKMGGINTYSWHPYSPVTGESSWSTDTMTVKSIIPGGQYHNEFKQQLDRLAIFFHSLQTEDGEKIPFIFRPWHEMDGSWFWWGKGNTSTEDFKELFVFTIDYLKNKKHLEQMVSAYSPDCNFQSEQDYLTWYPGDEYVDILGMDNYYDLKDTSRLADAISKLKMVIDVANKKNKFAALTETGLENMPDSVWFTQSLGKVLSDPKIWMNISYTMVWRNDPDVHFFFTYPEQIAADDAKIFLSQPYMLLLKDFNALKEDKKTTQN